MKCTKKSLFASALALVACLALLMGATFAWFTDSVNNTGNIIQAGTLDIQLNDGDETTLFSSDDLWEPGYSQKTTASVRNGGSLWLKYTMSFDNVQITGGADITQVLDVYAVEGDSASAGDLTTDNYLGTMAELMAAGSFAAKDAVLAPEDSGENAGNMFTLVIKMQENAGNEYQGAGVSFDVTILATQYTHEQDGFGRHTYDEGALYENGDGTYSDGSGLYVRVDGEYIPVTADASVSGWYTDEEGTNYVAGADAVKAVFASAEDGENITFIDDVSISSIGTDTYITAERVTIDLNNHTVSVDYGTDGNSFSVTGDGSVVKNGTFKCIGSRTDYPLWITGNIGSANVVVENVTVEGGMQVTGTVHATLKDVTISANNYYDVYLAQNSRVTVESGSFTSNGTQPHFYIFNYSSSYNPTVIINGGEFDGTPSCSVKKSNYPYTFTDNRG